jgi:hypothetical protein
MDVGFTGTRFGMSRKQKETVLCILRTLNVDAFHHGDCVGADMDAATIAKNEGLYVVSHPPIDEGDRAFAESDEVRDPMTMLKRNRCIVDSSALLIATPTTDRETPRSGTWYTIRYALKVGRPVRIVSPSGKLVTEEDDINSLLLKGAW